MNDKQLTMAQALGELVSDYRIEADKWSFDGKHRRCAIIREQADVLDEYRTELILDLHDEDCAAVWLDVARYELAHTVLQRLDAHESPLAPVLRRIIE